MRLCREIGALYIDTVVEPWPGFYFDTQRRPGGAHQQRAPRHGARGEGEESRRHDRRLLLRRQSRHGVVVRQAGADRPRRRPRPRIQRAGRDDRERLGAADARPRREGHPHRRARHAAREKPEADERLRQHLVGRGFSVGRHAAGRARLGHAREVAAGERPAGDDRLEAPAPICCSPAPIRACAPGARRPARNSAFS